MDPQATYKPSIDQQARRRVLSVPWLWPENVFCNFFWGLDEDVGLMSQILRVSSKEFDNKYEPS